MNNRTANKKKGLSLKGLKPYYIITGLIIFLLIILIMLLTTKKETAAADAAGPAERGPSSVQTEPAEKAEPAERVPPRKGPEQKAAPVITAAAADRPVERPRPPEKAKGTVCLVIDDVGNSTEQLAGFLQLDIPMTFAVMPYRRYTEECVRMIEDAGKSYILHQPMEAIGGNDPGPSAIMTDMSDEEIRKTLERNFAQLPNAKGMNNHMGSKATSDERVMSVVMDYLNENDLFFLDSFTISDSLGYETAKEFSVKYIRRNAMFLDNEKTHEAISAAVDSGFETARKKGHAVMIGHIMTDELAGVMLELFPNFIEDGFSLREISEIFIEMNSTEDLLD